MSKTYRRADPQSAAQSPIAHQMIGSIKRREDTHDALQILASRFGWLRGLRCNMPMPARYIIDTDGTIAYAEVNPDYTKRSEPSDLFPVLDQLAAA